MINALTFLLLSFVSPAKADTLKTLSVGNEWTLSSAASVWIESKAVLTAREHRDGVIITARRVGTSGLRVDGKHYKVRVVSPNARTVFDRLTEAVRPTVGLKADWCDAIPCITGRLYSVADYEKILRVFELNEPWEFRAQVPQPLREKFEDALIRELGDHAPVRPLLFEETPTVLLRDSNAVEKWTRRTMRFGLVVRKEERAVETAPVVRVEIAVAEVRKDRAEDLGIKWPSTFNATLMLNNKWASEGFPFEAKAFESKGLGRILARPNLICRSGKEAEFVAGGEFPIKVVSSKYNSSVIWKNYGITLKIKPVADAAGRISLSIETEVSTVDPSRTVDGVPGLLTNRVSSHFDLNRPRTVVLSGLIKSESSHHRDGVFGLSSLPILGALFSSQAWKENRTELVIFVRPEIAREVL